MSEQEQMETDDELLTAYLDDEMSETEKELVRVRLLSEPLFSKRLQELQRAWDALDDLPDAQADQQFTRSTLELVTANLVEESAAHAETKAGFPITFLRKHWSILLLISSAFLGSLAGNLSRLSKDRSHYRTLEVIANLPGLKAASIMASQPDEIDAIVKTVTDVPNWEILSNHAFRSRMLPALPKDLSAREAWYGDLKNEHKTLMWRYNREWERMPSKQHAEYRVVQNAINAGSDPSHVRTVLTVVAAVLESIPDSERGIFRSLPRQEQLDRLREFCCMAILDWYVEQWDSETRDELAQIEYQNLEDWYASLPQWHQEVFRRMGWAADQASWENLLMPVLSRETQSLFRSLKDKDRTEKFRAWFLLLNRNATIGRVGEKASFEAYLSSDASRRELMDLRSAEEVQRMLAPQFFRPNRNPQSSSAPPSPGRQESPRG